MKLGVMKDALPGSLKDADLTFATREIWAGMHAAHLPDGRKGRSERRSQ